jgi:hypothetical protein
MAERPGESRNDASNSNNTNRAQRQSARSQQSRKADSSARQADVPKAYGSQVEQQ